VPSGAIWKTMPGLAAVSGPLLVMPYRLPSGPCVSPYPGWVPPEVKLKL